MTAIITLPESLATLLQRRAAVEQRSIESLAIASIEAGLTETPEAVQEPEAFEPSPELLELVAQIKATPRNPASIIPAQGNLAAVIRELEALTPDDDYDVHEEIAALDAAEEELRAINRADDSREGRG